MSFYVYVENNLFLFDNAAEAKAFAETASRHLVDGANVITFLCYEV